ncbi:MAG: SMP-30/gluconolactonase/LRE family protein [Bacteroidota bacterium]|nr:SMP-30/gluconolactonase/LRE family protein [Bacteroidota bacterium]
MSKQTFINLLAVLLFFIGSEVFAHPGSGIVVDRQGNIYFVDTGSGVWKIDLTGKLTRIPGPSYHWMAIDVDGRLANVKLPYFSSEDATVTRVGSNPTLLLSSDFPISVGRDGSLYYPWVNSEQQVQIFRIAPSGNTTVVKTLPPARSPSGELRWRNGIAVTSDGSIYYTEDRAVRKISPEGELTTVISDLNVPGCGSAAGVEPELGPYCRGIAVDSAGTVYVAAAGCGAVLRISTDKKVTTILHASSPWSPSAVAVSGNNLYVLEYIHTANENRREWLPRVRKVSSDGSVTTIATIDRQ